MSIISYCDPFIHFVSMNLKMKLTAYTVINLECLAELSFISFWRRHLTIITEAISEKKFEKEQSDQIW